GRDRHKFILIDSRPVAIIPAAAEALTSKIKAALSEAKIAIVNSPEEFREILSANTIIVGSNGIGNPNTTGTSPDMADLIHGVNESLGLTNTTTPSLYNRSQFAANLVEKHPSLGGLIGGLQKGMNVLTDAHE